MKRIGVVTVVLALALSTSAFATKKSAFGIASNATSKAAGEFVVPITIEYDNNLTALDIPLKWSDGATLTEVKFGDMLAGFDFKIANIDNENNRVIIGAINMVYSPKPELSLGSGVLAELVFKANPGVTSITIEKTVLTKPNHDLYFVYNDYDENNVPRMAMNVPEFAPVTVAFSEGAGGNTSAVPTVFEMDQNYPNPFNPTTKIKFGVAEPGMVTLSVFNVIGQKVKTLVDGHRDASYYEVEWDGRDDNGATVASGVYFYKVEANSGRFVQTRSMMLLK